jgi:3-oxoacyl-[acyl-carrier-protein] synthase-3
MALKAALRALEMSSTRPEDLDLIVVGTISPDMPMPACAAFLAQKLGAKKAFAFDVSAACAGSLFGMSIASQYIATGMVKRALVVGVELLTRIIDWSDRNTCVLFGDAAGAMVLGPSSDEGRGILSTHLHTDGEQTGILCLPGGGSKHPVSPEMIAQKLHKVSMQGREVYKFAVRALTDAVHEALAANQATAEGITHVIAHQANIRIIQAASERLGIPMENAVITLDRYGNTSSASIPMAFWHARDEGRVKKGEYALMTGFGAGMTWASSVLKWSM